MEYNVTACKSLQYLVFSRFMTTVSNIFLSSTPENGESEYGEISISFLY